MIYMPVYAALFTIWKEYSIIWEKAVWNAKYIKSAGLQSMSSQGTHTWSEGFPETPVISLFVVEKVMKTI